MTGDDDPVHRAGREVLRAAAVDLTGKALVLVVGSLLAAFVLLVAEGGSVPAWVCAPLVGLTALVAAAKGRSVRAATGERENLVDEIVRHEEYSKHVAQCLDMLQRVVSGDLDVPVLRYIEQGILEPARDLLMERPAENVRLSILLPDPDDEDRWWMALAAGHTLTGKEKYCERIVDTLSRHAFESGSPQSWPDVHSDSGFRQNPLATAPTRTLLSLPIRRGDEVLGVFNAVSAEPSAFDPAEDTYLTSLGGVIAVAVNVWLQSESKRGA